MAVVTTWNIHTYLYHCQKVPKTLNTILLFDGFDMRKKHHNEMFTAFYLATNVYG